MYFRSLPSEISYFLLLLESNENVIFNYEIERWSYLEGCSALFFCALDFFTMMEGNELTGAQGLNISLFFFSI